MYQEFCDNRWPGLAMTSVGWNYLQLDGVCVSCYQKEPTLNICNHNWKKAGIWRQCDIKVGSCANYSISVHPNAKPQKENSWRHSYAERARAVLVTGQRLTTWVNMRLWFQKHILSVNITFFSKPLNLCSSPRLSHVSLRPQKINKKYIFVYVYIYILS
jgi:hypothetical protein